jgi:hypothetical protein
MRHVPIPSAGIVAADGKRSLDTEIGIEGFVEQIRQHTPRGSAGR